MVGAYTSKTIFEKTQRRSLSEAKGNEEREESKAKVRSLCGVEGSGPERVAFMSVRVFSDGATAEAENVSRTLTSVRLHRGPHTREPFLLTQKSKCQFECFPTERQRRRKMYREPWLVCDCIAVPYPRTIPSYNNP
jgi:hypothetical protein